MTHEGRCVKHQGCACGNGNGGYCTHNYGSFKKIKFKLIFTFLRSVRQVVAGEKLKRIADNMTYLVVSS